MTLRQYLKRDHYQFTRYWFRHRNFITFREYVYPVWAGRPISYLEIGVFEGQSISWMLEQVLTHPDSRAVGIDPWLMTTKIDEGIMEKVRVRAYHNTGVFPNCQLFRGTSIDVLGRMLRKGNWKGFRPNCFDLCMIDGDHNQYGVLADALLCFKLVRPGGWLLFDDVENQVRKTKHVREGVDMFLEQVGSQVKLLWKDRFMECYEVQE